jgi:eukaryotic-like serine/threonine-protein kinase
MTLKAETVLHERYHIESLLGQGGMGAVYKAFDTLHDQDCAIKEMNLVQFPENDTDLKSGNKSNSGIITREKAAYQFKREAKLLAGLDHSNLPKVTDYFSIGDDFHYLVMTLVNGKDLASLLENRRDQPFPETQVLEWIGQISNALGYCHNKNIAHRDVKPANIIVTDTNKVFLVDFGIAKNINKASPGITIGTQVLTPKYSPPEQYTGQGLTDERSDIYSLGATMYTLLTGKQPMDAILRVMGNEMATPKQLMPSIAPVLDIVIRKAMSLKQEDRYQSIEEMRKAIFTDPYIMNTSIRVGKNQFNPETIKMSKSKQITIGDKKGSATLEIINRTNIGGTIIFNIYEPTSKIGRAAGAPETIHLDLTALDQSRIVSRVHATIECRNGRYLIKDNNSHNGTWINGQKLNANQDYLLKDGDDIRFGSQQPHGIQAVFRQILAP